MSISCRVVRHVVAGNLGRLGRVESEARVGNSTITVISEAISIILYWFFFRFSCYQKLHFALLLNKKSISNFKLMKNYIRAY